MLIFLILNCSILSAQDNFVRGVFLFGNTNVDFQHQMHDTLGLNWVQAQGEDSSGYKFTNVLQNSGNLNVMGQMNQIIYPKSSGQHMVFLAAQNSSNPLKDYFATRIGSTQDSTLEDAVNRDYPGYMVESPVPNNEYHGQTSYMASFILKRTPPNSGDPLVVRLEAWCVNNGSLLASQDIYNHDFTDNNFETKVLNFNLPSQQGQVQKPQGVLLGSPIHASQSSGCLLNNEYNINICVYWYGNMTTWLNQVIIEDSPGHELFSGTDDAAIQNSALSFKTAYPLVNRFYLNDEPYISQFLSFNYVQGKILQKYAPDDTTSGKGSGITAEYQDLSRFFLDAQPHELLTDFYAIKSDIPTPDMTDAEATDVGIVLMSSVDYTQTLQDSIQKNYIGPLGSAAVTVSGSGKQLWCVPQLHGVCFSEVWVPANIGKNLP